MKTENFFLKMKTPSIRNKLKPMYLAVLLVAFFSTCGLQKEPEYIGLNTKFTIIDSITGERILGSCGKFAYCPDTIKAYNKAGEKFYMKTRYDKVYENNIVVDSVPYLFVFLMDMGNEQFIEKYGNELIDTAFLYLNHADCDTITFSISMQNVVDPATKRVYYNGMRLFDLFYQIKKQKQ
ncbi:MAG TPA: hypothetical protein DCQ31_08195 [Bacteroidales bacterium]|nr:hypothetical protein [Bacteroidales bacterium]